MLELNTLRMKTICSTLLLLLISVTLSIAQQNDTLRTIGPFQWNERVIDCGFISGSEVKTVKFIFKNISTKKLTIKNVLSTSGEVMPYKYPKEVAAGETGEVELNVNPIHSGSFSKSVMVTSDEIAAPTRLTIKGSH